MLTQTIDYMIGTIAIITAVSLLLAAMFAGVEMAFSSSNRLKIEGEKRKNRAFNHIASLLGRNQEQFFATVTLGDAVALVLYALGMSMLIRIVGAGDAGLGAGAAGAGVHLSEIVVAALIFIIVARFIPKVLVRVNPAAFYKALAIPVYIFYILFWPVAKIVALISKTYENTESFDKDDLVQMLDEVTEIEDQGQSETDANIRLFQNALDFPDLLVRECMVPRVDIEAVDRSCSIGELTAKFIETHFSRMPLYDGNIDNIIGYTNIKSLYRMPGSIAEITKQIDYVPETMPAQRLLGNFIKQRHSIAIVIDEFGGTAGMITIEDILEEIFGEIDDEHDMQEMVEKKVSETEYILSGRLEIEYLNEKYRLALPESDEYDTLAGYVIFLHQEIPATGDTITDGNHQLRVMKADNSKIELIRLTITAVN